MNPQNETVILLHGLARTACSMNKLNRAFTKRGYATVNYDYPSRSLEIEQLSEQVIKSALARCQRTGRIHFVTHSLGGILLRYYLSQHDITNLGHVIMLGPPNHGSELADKLQQYSIYRCLLGPAAMQVGTNAQSLPNRIGPPTYSVGIIAGDHSINWLGSQLLPKPNDGTVSVASTCLANVDNHLVLPVSHPFMMSNAIVIRQTLYFIQHGRFCDFSLDQN